MTIMIGRWNNMGKAMQEADLPKLIALVRKMLRNPNVLRIVDEFKSATSG